MLMVGIDLGYGYTKAVASNGKSFSIPSLIGEGFNRRYSEIFGVRDDFGPDNIHVQLGGEHYFVGYLAALESSTCSYAFDKNRIEHINTRVLLATAVALLMNGQEDDISIAVGLPFGDFVTQGQQFRDYLNSFDEIVKIHGRNSPAPRRVRFVRAVPFPQSAGAVYHLADEYRIGDGISQGLVGCIDIGTRTTDVMVFTTDKMYPVESMSGTIDAGSHIVHSYLQTELNEKYGISAEVYELENVVRYGTSIVKRGNPIDLTEATAAGKKDLAKKLRDEITKLWGSRMDNLSRVFLVGGGAILLSQHLHKIYNMTVIPREAEMLNAKGFLHVARLLAKDYREHVAKGAV